MTGNLTPFQAFTNVVEGLRALGYGVDTTQTGASNSADLKAVLVGDKDRFMLEVAYGEDGLVTTHLSLINSELFSQLSVLTTKPNDNREKSNESSSREGESNETGEAEGCGDFFGSDSI